MFDFGVLKKRLKKAGEEIHLGGESNIRDEHVEVIPKLKAPRGQVIDLLKYGEKLLARANVMESGKYLVFEPVYTTEDIDKLEEIKVKEKVDWDFNFVNFYEKNKNMIVEYTVKNILEYSYYLYKTKYGCITPLLLDKEVKEIYNIGDRVYILRGDRDYLTNVIFTPQDLEILQEGEERREVSIENGLKMIVDDSLTIISDKEFNPIELLEYKFLPDEILAYLWTVIRKKASILLVGPDFLSQSFRFFDQNIVSKRDIQKVDETKTYLLSKEADKDTFKRMSYGYPTIVHLDLNNSDLYSVFEHLIQRGIKKPMLQFVDVIVIFSDNKLTDVYEVKGYNHKTDELDINSTFRFNPLVNKFDMNEIFLFNELSEDEKNLFSSSIDFLQTLLERKVTDNMEVQKRIKQFEERFIA